MRKFFLFGILFFLSLNFYAEETDAKKNDKDEANFLLDYIQKNKIDEFFIKSAGLKDKSEIKFDKNGKMIIPNNKAKKVVEKAKKLIGKKNYRFIQGAYFPWDCSGTILALHYLAGIDLKKSFLKYQGNGVKRLYAIAKKERKILYTEKFPLPGDVIFWDNTYDKNKNKKWDDELIHIGIVIAVDKDGTIDYIHLNYITGVVIAHMNLFHPNVKTVKRNGKTITINSPMRMRKDIYLNPKKYLSSHLFRSFGRLYK